MLRSAASILACAAVSSSRLMVTFFIEPPARTRSVLACWMSASLCLPASGVVAQCGPIVEILTLRIALRRAFEGKGLALPPSTVSGLVLALVAQLPAQHFPDVARQAHILLGGLHPGARRSLLIQGDGDVLHLKYTVPV